MKISDILLTLGFQSLLISFCAYFSYSSWNEYQQNLFVIGCLCLFGSIFLYYIDNIPTTLNKIESNASNKSVESRIKSPSKSIRNVCNNNDENISKRSDYLKWDEYFLSVATLSSMRSKDPSTQVGACIVNENNRIVGIGYNGFPTGCNDDILPWNRKHSKGINHTKYPYVVHAETNAILNKNSESCQNCIMYVILFPCNDCAKLIIQSGIKQIIYISDKYKMTQQVIASKKLLDLAGVKYKQYIPENKSILLKFPEPQ